MAYSRTYWQDEARLPQHTFQMTTNGDKSVTLTKVGKEIQAGTPQSAANFNNMETGIFAANLAAMEFGSLFRLVSERVEALVGFFVEDTLTNKSTNTYPFVDTEKIVTLSGADTRTRQDYTVTVEAEPTGGFVKEILVYDKMTNGFKVAYTGSAQSCKIRCFIQGGK